MKYETSTKSLHTSSSSAFVLREQPHNSTLSLYRTAKPPPRKDFNSVYNARGRLNTLRDAVNIIAQQAREAQVSNKELKLQINFLSEEYLQRRLQQLQGLMTGKVKQLRKKVVIGKRSDLLKYESIHNIFDSLAKSHKELVGKVQMIEERVEQLENIMGGGALRNKLGR